VAVRRRSTSFALPLSFNCDAALGLTSITSVPALDCV
jgi:hypothetical protein